MLVRAYPFLAGGLSGKVTLVTVFVVLAVAIAAAKLVYDVTTGSLSVSVVAR